ncbi:Phosphodiester glycosidase family protein [Candidatus Megaera venefica]|uniref:Phosphodiester glycosidase family protein n=1 Tax=Candidatus Megaera venefica TaxID=2055910 RepID=A0ABU5NCJ8_9RICK|nr:phosphodiester glycosidase family protein [Candidatus Megaera venefica]MEA0970866.1 Phosphodiester glycosidase family protein [Candidatus Megaera venefica]
MSIFKALILIFILLLSLPIKADHQYNLIERDGHKIHVVIIDPKEYKASLVVAHDQVFGRERVGEIAKRENAQIAINAGFFEIGDNQDGRPTGTLVSNGEVYGMRVTEHACLVKNVDKFSVEIVTPSLEVSIAKKIIKPNKFNRFAKGKDVFYFNRNWGPSTLSSYSDRKEVIINREFKVHELSMHGNSKIPEGGYVLSFPTVYDLSEIKVGQKVQFTWTPNHFAKSDNFSVMGLPSLIINGKTRENLSNEEKHARTAFGIKEDGNIVIVLAEHVYRKEASSVTFSEVKKIMDKKNISIVDMKVADMKKIIFDDLNTDSKSVGLTMLELANFMKEMGCYEAINLDGGGSSTMYVDGKYINESFGDKDEAEGQKLVRPISDAIVFKLR